MWYKNGMYNSCRLSGTQREGAVLGYGSFHSNCHIAVVMVSEQLLVMVSEQLLVMVSETIGF